ncbi:glutamine--fructose-6-phosphate transaminase (isomerizing) [Alcaligenes faecalis]|jgi:glucosamine--fructose-6-phosphate aminotransferase (isomerizing)|uniref:Glutamine--fructose-6-phosphate aminotransferase [isomerizing] n=3 Tax=Alcaligenes TaxID=507 RepID=A0AAE9HBR8_ALCFA|nr:MULTISPECIES: glutamine--fructose-6-phosphate transaminase (isomerizing) [Alcaligenes]MDH4865764.1 glutamine--fructose-6-phosphate transaminase (isomerizing) [Bacillus cereus]ERT54829.1 glucosamine--fructose-6-phosphate aminotransferase [Alcaligenes sp. EGD-AK7]KGP02948.1 glucosamine--fructose-6-phosphate aminotransferase [Alcaligenes faecalis]KVX04761.1 glutamine--fructose-6-phosphate aminotransferase [Alcaligenes faecalis]MBH0312003.1 glutamine--fructose-6-phosphate transaminase (isomeriz
MCGIVGAVAQRDIVPVLLEGLKRLEYRGYDSCGVAVHAQGQLLRARSTQRVAELQEQVKADHLQGFTGIAHTRWATHGAPATHNAHPHFSGKGKARIALVHNGIIENHDELRAELQSIGYVFESQTDTEVIAHLIDHLYNGDLFEAVQQVIRRLTGAYAIAVFCQDEPHRVVGARHGSPLVVGVGQNENFLASDALALAGTTDQIIYLEDGDVIDLQINKVWIMDKDGRAVDRPVHTVHLHTAAAELGPYRHFMQKEIFEQPRAVGDTLQDIESVTPELFGDQAYKVFQDIDNVLILACGTSYYAGLTARYWIESLAKIPVNVEIASEYRYRDSVPNPRTLVVTISQSGETADTLAALKHARSLGMEQTLTICNVATSAMVRECKLSYITRAGVEIGVASTKAFTTQLTALFLLTIALAQVKGHLNQEQEGDYLKALRHLPTAIAAVLALEPQIMAWADRFASKENALFLGRGMHYPIAMEGALKLKEISYIHAEGYPAGELKHGPLALVTEAMPVVTIAPRDELLEKLKSNIEEVHARGGELYVFADADTRIGSSERVHVIRMPEHYGKLSPILHTVTLQLLAYHTACSRGTDVDKPRNLAKSVTVE